MSIQVTYIRYIKMTKFDRSESYYFFALFTTLCQILPYLYRHEYNVF
jgi:hypothetical protein